MMKKVTITNIFVATTTVGMIFIDFPVGITLLVFCLCRVIYETDKMQGKKDEWYVENAPLGRALGYPECCIREFCAHPPEYLKNMMLTQKDINRYRASFKDGKYTGFIPCGSHAEQILAGEVTIDSLITNRSKEYPTFPNL